MTGKSFARQALAALGLCACAATAAPPREVFITREVQDLYRVGTGTYYIKTIGCSENVVNDRGGLRFNIGGRGGMLLFRSGKQCVIEKFFQEVDSFKVQSAPSLF